MKIFVTGIDTNVGKTICTGMLAKELYQKNQSVITMKLVQTGCETSISEDILTHRKIMGVALTQEDEEGLTCPYVFTYPSSPHLAAELDKKKIDVNYIHQCIEKVSEKYQTVFIEGAGGLYVPLNEEITIFDWFMKNLMPVIVVATPKLGSINHTLLTMETLLSHNVRVMKIIYNLYFNEDDVICESTFEYLQRRYKEIPIVKQPAITFL